jgi:hypothetical protein
MDGEEQEVGNLQLGGSGSDRAGRVTLLVEVTPEVSAYLDELAGLQLWGMTPEEVADSLLQHCIRQVIADGTLRLRKPGPGKLWGERRQ